MSDENEALTGATDVPAVPETDKQEAESSTEVPKEQQARDEKGKFIPQERLNEVTRARREAERRAEAAERALEEIRSRQPAPQSQGSKPPSLEDCGFDVTKHQQAVIEWASKQTETLVERKFREQQAQQTIQQAAQSFESKSREYAKSHPDFDADMDALNGSGVRFQPEVAEVIALSEHGPAVAHYLAQHLDEADRLARMPAHLAAAQVARIEGKVSAPKPKPVSNASAPVPRVGGGSKAAPDLNDAEMPLSDWLAARRAQLKKA